MQFSKWTVVMLGALCAAPLPAVQGKAPVASSQETKSEAQSADRLLRQVKAEAQTIEMHAADLERLAKNSNTQWVEYDQQWNEIKPAQEALDRNIRRLDAMSSSLSTQQQKTLNDTKQAVQQISARTRQLFKMIEQPGANLSSSTFQADARSLAQDARSVATIA